MLFKLINFHNICINNYVLFLLSHCCNWNLFYPISKYIKEVKLGHTKLA